MIVIALRTARIELGLDDATLKVVNRFLDLLDQGEKLQALVGRLNASGDALAKTVKDNPDPDPKD